MYNKDSLYEAARYNDAIVEEVGMQAWAARYHVDLPGLVAAAEQRAMRVAMSIDGIEVDTRTNKLQPVTLSTGTKKLLPFLIAASFDGMAIGIVAQKEA